MGVLYVPFISCEIFINATKISGGIMYNRKFNITKGNDYKELVELEHEIMPIIYNTKFEVKEEKEQLINYVRYIFNNQWKQKGE